MLDIISPIRIASPFILVSPAPVAPPAQAVLLGLEAVVTGGPRGRGGEVKGVRDRWELEEFELDG